MTGSTMEGIHILIGGKEVATHIVELTSKAEAVQQDIDALRTQSRSIDATSINARLDNMERQGAEVVSSMKTIEGLPEAVADSIASFQAALEKKFIDIEERLLNAESSKTSQRDLAPDAEWKNVLKSLEEKQEKATAEANGCIADLNTSRSNLEARLTACEAQFASTLGHIKKVDERLLELEQQHNEAVSSMKAMVAEAMASGSTAGTPQNSALEEKFTALSQDLKVRLSEIESETQGLREDQDQLNQRIPKLLEQVSQQNTGISDLVQNMKDSQTLQSEQRQAQSKMQEELQQFKAGHTQILEDVSALKVEQLQIREMVARETQDRGAALAKASAGTDSAMSKFQSQLKRCEAAIEDEVKAQIEQLKDGLENHSHELSFAGRSGPGYIHQPLQQTM